MGAFGHLGRGTKIAFSNMGASALLAFSSFIAGWMSLGIAWPMVESWAILFMAATLTGRPGNLTTLKEVVNIRGLDLFVASIFFFGINFLVMFIFGGCVTIVTAFFGSLLAELGDQSVFIMVPVFIVFSACLFLPVAYLLVHLIFTPYLVTRGGMPAVEAFGESWKIARQFGPLKILAAMSLASLLGLLGLAFCFVGYFFTWPIVYGTVASIYHEVFYESTPNALVVEV